MDRQCETLVPSDLRCVYEKLQAIEQWNRLPLSCGTFEAAWKIILRLGVTLTCFCVIVCAAICVCLELTMGYLHVRKNWKGQNSCYRLGIGSRHQCEVALQKSSWNLEQAACTILDEMKG